MTPEIPKRRRGLETLTGADHRPVRIPDRELAKPAYDLIERLNRNLFSVQPYLGAIKKSIEKPEKLEAKVSPDGIISSGLTFTEGEFKYIILRSRQVVDDPNKGIRDVRETVRLSRINRPKNESAHPDFSATNTEANPVPYLFVEATYTEAAIENNGDAQRDEAPQFEVERYLDGRIEFGEVGRNESRGVDGKTKALQAFPEFFSPTST